MKKYCIIFLLSCIIILTGYGFSGMAVTKSSPTSQEYLRMHIRADSNDSAAQAVKYLVRDGVVEYLTPLVAAYSDKQSAYDGLKAHLQGIENAANEVLHENGFSYTCKAELKKERFPVRIYGEYTLPAGEYDALILSLGKGVGDNWWCVVYPPLCFTAPTGKNVGYKSKIWEIIQAWSAK